MKVVAFNGSARKDGNTAVLIKKVFEELEKEGIKTELVQMAGQKVQGCIGCMKCFSNKNKRCAVTTDIINEYIAKMWEADGIIIGSPTYFADVTVAAKALIERAGMVGRANAGFLKRKVGAAVVAVRRGGAIQTFETINNFFMIEEMIVPGSSYWNMGIGREPGKVEGDEEGMATMKTLGQNMAWLLKKLNPNG